MSFSNIFKSITGQFEVARVSLVCGGFLAVTSPIGFEIWEMGWKNGHFDVTAWCLAYGAMLVTLIAGGAFAIGNKEKQVAAAQATRDASAPSPKLDL